METTRNLLPTRVPLFLFTGLPDSSLITKIAYDGKDITASFRGYVTGHTLRAQTEALVPGRSYMHELRMEYTDSAGRRFVWEITIHYRAGETLTSWPSFSRFPPCPMRMRRGSLY